VWQVNKKAPKLGGRRGRKSIYRGGHTMGVVKAEVRAPVKINKGKIS